jgi:predicted nuclease with TOPRIM domain
MDKLQEAFNRIQEIKKEQKRIKSAYRDALVSSPTYKKVTDELKEIRDKKKKIEEGIKIDFSGEFTKLDDIKIDLESEYELINDIALTQLMKGETVKVTDQYDNSYDPIFSVKFKRTT